MAREIVSIASALGWSVQIEDAGEVYSATLVGWALVAADGGDRVVVGLVQRATKPGVPAGSIGFADEIPGFAGYAFTGRGA